MFGWVNWFFTAYIGCQPVFMIIAFLLLGWFMSNTGYNNIVYGRAIRAQKNYNGKWFGRFCLSIGIIYIVGGFYGLLFGNHSNGNLYNAYQIIDQGSFFNLAKYLRAFSVAVSGHPLYYLFCGIGMLGLYIFILRLNHNIIPMTYYAKKPDEAFKKWALFQKMITIVFPLVVTVFGADFFVHLFTGMTKAHSYIQSRGSFFKMNYNDVSYWRIIAISICLYVTLCYCLILWGRLCQIKTDLKDQKSFALKTFPVALIISLFMTYSIYPLVGICLPVVLILGFFGYIATLFGDGPKSSLSETDQTLWDEYLLCSIDPDSRARYLANASDSELMSLRISAGKTGNYIEEQEIISAEHRRK